MIDIIPAIDLIDGKCVRLTQGDYSSKKTYNEFPLDVAKRFEDHGISRLHLVDLDGAKAGRPVNYKVLEQIASKTQLIIDFSGGLRTDKDLEIAFNSGTSKVSIGSIAVKNNEIFINWLQKYGPEKIILGADAKNEKVAVSGWEEDSSLDLIPFIKEQKSYGVTDVICTDVSKDGMLEGPSIELYKKIISEIENINLIASGGVHNILDLEKLSAIGVRGVIIGKAIYEGRIQLKDLKSFLC